MDGLIFPLLWATCFSASHRALTHPTPRSWGPPAPPYHEVPEHGSFQSPPPPVISARSCPDAQVSVQPRPFHLTFLERPFRPRPFPPRYPLVGLCRFYDKLQCPSFTKVGSYLLSLFSDPWCVKTPNNPQTPFTPFFLLVPLPIPSCSPEWVLLLHLRFFDTISP